MSKFEMLKKLEHLVVFQNMCLANGNWDEFDFAENEVRKLEGQILQVGEVN